MIGLGYDQRSTFVIYIDDDGSLGQGHLSDFKVNWRFDENSRRWLNVDTGEELESEDGNSED